MRRFWIIVSCLALASVTVLADSDDSEEDGLYGEIDAGAEEDLFDGLEEGDSDEGTVDRRRKRDLYGSNAYAGATASGFGGTVPGYQTGLGSGSLASASAGSSSYSGARTSSVANAFANTHVRYAAPVVQKHFYYHAAPPEAKATAVADTLTITPRKHYKIIFIKAPSVSADAGAAARAASQIEEKTIVYVLTNKPTAKANAGAQADASTFSSGKPEVYFIKYQGNDAHAAVAKSSTYSSGAAGYAGDSSAYSGAAGASGYPGYNYGSSYSGASANAGSSVGGFGARSGASGAAGSGIGAYPGYAPSSRVFF